MAAYAAGITNSGCFPPISLLDFEQAHIFKNQIFIQGKLNYNGPFV